MRQAFLEDLRLGPGPVTAAHQHRLDKLWVTAAAVAKANAQAKAEAETKQAAFQATEEARMRRANRLADALAKRIVSQHRLPQWALALVKTTGKLIKHQAARIGVATYLANNYEEQVTLDGGATATRFRRDSTAARPHFQRKGKSATVQQSASHQAAANTGSRASAGTSFAAATSMPHTPHRRGKRAATLAACELRRLADQEAALARCLSAKRLRPSTGPGATERLAAIRDKVLARSCRG